jgi:hypothetical protein
MGLALCRLLARFADEKRAQVKAALAEGMSIADQIYGNRQRC